MNLHVVRNSSKFLVQTTSLPPGILLVFVHKIGCKTGRFFSQVEFLGRSAFEHSRNLITVTLPGVDLQEDTFQFCKALRHFRKQVGKMSPEIFFVRCFELTKKVTLSPQVYHWFILAQHQQGTNS